jgi:hypothetical protein
MPAVKPVRFERHLVNLIKASPLAWHDPVPEPVASTRVRLVIWIRKACRGLAWHSVSL